MINSTFWVILIAVGALVVAVANIQYNRARELESKKEMAAQALVILKPELERYLRIVIEMQKTLPKNEIPFEAFDTAAWQTVSNGELLLGLGDNVLPNMMRIYNLMNRANSLHSRILEMSIGVTSTISGNSANRVQPQNRLLAILGELEPILRDVAGQNA